MNTRLKCAVLWCFVHFALAYNADIKAAILNELRKGEYSPVFSQTPSYKVNQNTLLIIRDKDVTNSIDVNGMVPVLPGAYKAYKLGDVTHLQMNPKYKYKWRHILFTLTPSNDLLPLQGVGNNTGARDFALGVMVKARGGVVCDDSCAFGFNGVCNERFSQDEGYYQDAYDQYAYYQDACEGDCKKNEGCQVGTDCSDCGGMNALLLKSPPSKEVLYTQANTQQELVMSSGQWVMAAAASLLALVSGMFVGRRLRRGRSSGKSHSNADSLPPADVESCASDEAAVSGGVQLPFREEEASVSPGVQSGG